MKQASNPLRAIALLSPDTTAREALLLALGETTEEAREQISNSSWKVALDSGFLQLEMWLLSSSQLVDNDAVENYVIRAVALMTNHEPVRACLLHILAETPEVARQQLMDSCWSECLSFDGAVQRMNLAREFGLPVMV